VLLRQLEDRGLAFPRVAMESTSLRFIQILKATVKSAT
jgi:hypothetical protein